MKKLLGLSLFLTAAFAASCGGGGSGVDGDKYIDELSADEVKTLCEWGVGEQGGAGTKTCTANVEITVDTAAECEAEYNAETAPHCIVKALEGCLTSTGGDACKILMTEECAAYFQCATQSSME
jgi:hypothetical protein